MSPVLLDLLSNHLSLANLALSKWIRNKIRKESLAFNGKTMISLFDYGFKMSSVSARTSLEMDGILNFDCFHLGAKF